MHIHWNIFSVLRLCLLKIRFDGRLVLTDMTGRMVDMREGRGTVFSGTLADRPAGVYMLKALGNRGSGAVVRLVKQD